MSQQTCENGLLFDPALAETDAVHNHCVYSWKAECGGRPADLAPQSSPGCQFRYHLHLLLLYYCTNSGLVCSLLDRAVRPPTSRQRSQ